VHAKQRQTTLVCAFNQIQAREEKNKQSKPTKKNKNVQSLIIVSSVRNKETD